MYTKNKNGTFTVISKSRGTIKWIVSMDMKKCNCPKFKFITKGQPCHHIDEVVTGERKKKPHIAVTPVKNGFIKFDINNYKDPLPIVQFVKIYGNDQLDDLLVTHDVITMEGKIRVLK